MPKCPGRDSGPECKCFGPDRLTAIGLILDRRPFRHGDAIISQFSSEPIRSDPMGILRGRITVPCVSVRQATAAFADVKVGEGHMHGTQSHN